MTVRLECRGCKRAMKHPTPSGYGPVCARKRGLTPRKTRRTRTARPPKPAAVPAAPDVIPGQMAIDLVFHQPTLESL
ncbi:hypothetical protein [Streptomyces sp. AS02]|uniref:hypothetical protein n=1 Tax=Streptomyces sp. AS02 TaxID=2938946 RepID=UPI0020225C0E|nr:hypothetical protein [Streptomyces sp. AS02]MCL8016891.1 hypothetical protein [Streptomyces sp. AS02]